MAGSTAIRTSTTACRCFETGFGLAKMEHDLRAG